VFLTARSATRRRVVAFYVKHSRSLHQRVVALNGADRIDPWVAESARCSLAQKVSRISGGAGPLRIHGATGHTSTLASLQAPCGLGDLSQVTYFLAMKP